ncbi:MAG: alpha/beta hydrolase family protein, partial [Candidatus Entotheonellia bacterium]
MEVWDRTGEVLHKLASLPLADAVSTDGVPTGPRSYHWNAAEPATLVWVEALDGGDPKKEVPQRDRILMLRAPFQSPPVELIKTEHRYAGLLWGEQDGIALVSDYDRVRRWRRTFVLETTNLTQPPRLLFSRDIRDRYHHPGTPIMRRLPTGHPVVRQHRGSIYLSGAGATSEGDRPFLDRFDVKTLQAERLFQCDNVSYETVVALLDDEATQFVTRRESPKDPPNYVMRSDGGQRALTQFSDPTPSLRDITKQLVTYRRADGVELSFTLYLPAGYKQGTRLPTVVWAYSREYNDPATAGQVAGSTQRFTTLRGPSHLFYLLHGYAVLDNAAIPVIGDFQTVNDTYVDQIVMGAKAAIEKATELGITDPHRVGVGGHSYGAFMTANLLAHSDLFRAG